MMAQPPTISTLTHVFGFDVVSLGTLVVIVIPISASLDRVSRIDSHKALSFFLKTTVYVKREACYTHEDKVSTLAPGPVRRFPRHETEPGVVACNEANVTDL